MKSSEDLFELIKSLTKNEKRYFKIHSSLHIIGERNKYLDLFDAIEKQKVYDEQLIRKQFQKERFVNQLNVAKKYLYELILKSTRQYTSSINSKLRGYLDEVEFLMDKLLYKQAEAILLKAKLIAEKYEKHTVLLDISALEFRLLARQSFSTKTDKQLATEFEDVFASIEKQRNLVEYRKVITSIYRYASAEGNPHTRADHTFYKSIRTHSLFNSVDNALSFNAKKLHYQAMMVFYRSVFYNRMQNLSKAYLCTRKIVELYELYPQFIEEDFSGYHNSYRNLIASAVNFKKYDEVYAYVEKLKIIDERSTYLQHENFYFINNVLMVLAVNTGQFKKGVELVSTVQKEIRKRGFENSYAEGDLIFNYCFAGIYFGAGEYSKSGIYLNKIINNTLNIRNDLYCFAKFLMILVQYELGNEYLLESAIRSTYRYLYKRKRIHKFETLVLEFIRKKIPKINSKADRIEAFKKLKKEIVKISRDPYERENVEHFDFISWLESKISGRSFEEIVQEKKRGIKHITS